QNLGEQRFERSSFGQIMAVRAVSSPDGVLRRERRAHARRNGFLSDRKMTGPAGFPAFHHPPDSLLGPPDAQHASPAGAQARKRAVMRLGKTLRWRRKCKRHREA